MRNLTAFLAVFIVIFPLFLHAQDPARLPTNLFIQDMGAGLDARIREIPPRPSGLVGDNLLQEEWAKGNIYLYSGEVVKDMPLRLDVHYNLIEILFKGEIKVLEGERAKGFEWWDPSDSYYVSFFNARDYARSGGETLQGFFEVIVHEEKIKLFSYSETEVLQANYIPQLDAGNRDKQIVQKQAYYLALGDEHFVVKVPTSKKEFARLFGEQEAAVLSFIKENKLKIKKRPDLVRAVLYYSDLGK